MDKFVLIQKWYSLNTVILRVHIRKSTQEIDSATYIFHLFFLIVNTFEMSLKNTKRFFNNFRGHLWKNWKSKEELANGFGIKVNNRSTKVVSLFVAPKIVRIFLSVWPLIEGKRAWSSHYSSSDSSETFKELYAIVWKPKTGEFCWKLEQISMRVKYGFPVKFRLAILNNNVPNPYYGSVGHQGDYSRLILVTSYTQWVASYPRYFILICQHLRRKYYFLCLECTKDLHC